ncbi:hypothetical protein SERLA73DRAFT_177580 [Serpula lacrymans var. lacrymans S7.3]|uniref:Uncharacterized protein n=2 Tax=Serpula lacrymans var. lacrymans TaxID=341189 RepID=F8PP57_SERL3|nr:uncharacterized protein SERLADRAFT_461242 [Serpula lacrymans var. lacrymans S7.9]EGO01934.1 hypothetical protein SERLA73DRAFT_177580 [Serpula lacrymans var. lacrymans S7.3]EGO27560.1 hypothetical protein SERLADRAFT_461242 [Serpula lacrymans var. lacrymans S7.9]
MTDHYIPPPPAYEHSQQDKKVSEISDTFQSTLVISGTPVRTVTKTDHDWDGCEDGLEDPSQLPVKWDATVQPLRVQKKSQPAWLGETKVRGGRTPRPLPPNPAIQVEPPSRHADVDHNGSPWSTHQSYDEQHHATHGRGPSPFPPTNTYDSYEQVAGQHFADRSLPPSPLSSFHSSTTPGHRHRQSLGGYSPAAYPTAPYSQTDSSHSRDQTYLKFDPYVAYSNSPNEVEDHRAPNYITPAALYSSAISSHMHPSTIPAGHRYQRRQHMHTSSASAIPENLMHQGTATPLSHSTSYSQAYPSYAPPLMPSHSYESHITRSPSPRTGYPQMRRA